ncbi:hypothetical protein AVEN_96717-1 [Araneus ventricosus]|uniref:Retroviral polymerase SH3-like domain-containing protein n=1 Tax=Araneus ventricosus TaxID=182803 RepID=A0A4Y2E7N4_ARAVE|nr:hypothetical protein AVEN_96717-1 [Araneus ventricosus]
MDEGVRCHRLETELPNGLWAELAYTFIYLKNGFPYKSLNGKIPYTLIYGRKCSVRYLKVIDSLAYVYIEKHKRDKLDFKAKEGVLIGYALKTKGYRIWFPKERKVVDTKQVKFNEFKKGYSRTSLFQRRYFARLFSTHIKIEDEEITTENSSTRGKAGPCLISHNDVQKYCEDNNMKYDPQQFIFHHQVGELIPQSHTDDDSSGLENYHSTIVEPSSYEKATSYST